MLKALQQQLNSMAEDYDKSFEKQIKKRWEGDEVPKGLIEDLKMFITLLPRIEKRIFSLYVWLPDDSRLKYVSSQFLNYMYLPDDFIPENEKNGLFGYLDDAYAAGLFFELIIDEIQRTKQLRLKQMDKELYRQVIRLKRKTKSVIPVEAITIKQMIGELFEGDKTTYNQLFQSKVPA